MAKYYTLKALDLKNSLRSLRIVFYLVLAIVFLIYMCLNTMFYKVATGN